MVSKEVWLENWRIKVAKLPNPLRKVGFYILHNAMDSLYMDLVEFCTKSGLTESDVKAFCLAMDYDSFNLLRLDLALWLKKVKQGEPDAGTNILDKGNHLIYEIISALESSLLNFQLSQFDEVVKLLYEARGEILLVGYGASGTVAEYLTYKLVRLGIMAIFVCDSHKALYHIMSGKISAAVAISSSGAIPEVLDIVKMANDCGIPTVGILNRPKSPLFEYCRFRIVGGGGETPLTGGDLATKIAQLFTCEFLVRHIRETYPDTERVFERSAYALVTRRQIDFS